MIREAACRVGERDQPCRGFGRTFELWVQINIKSCTHRESFPGPRLPVRKHRLVPACKRPASGARPTAKSERQAGGRRQRRGKVPGVRSAGREREALRVIATTDPSTISRMLSLNSVSWVDSIV